MAVQGGELAAGAEPGGAADAESGDGLLGGAGVPEQRGDVVVGLAVAEVGPREGTRAMVAHAMEKVGHRRQQDWQVVVPAGGGQPVRQVRLIVGELLGELSCVCTSIVAEDESLLPPGDTAATSSGDSSQWCQLPSRPSWWSQTRVTTPRRASAWATVSVAWPKRRPTAVRLRRDASSTNAASASRLAEALALAAIAVHVRSYSCLGVRSSIGATARSSTQS